MRRIDGRGARRRGARALTGATRAATWACVVLLLACRGGPSPAGTLTWYVNPDNGGQARLAAKCSAASGGRYRIEVHELPRDATGQREQLVRRLAAQDASIDLVNVDPPFLPELANAGFLRAFTPGEAGRLTEGARGAAARGDVAWPGVRAAFDVTVDATEWLGPQQLAYAPYHAGGEVAGVVALLARELGAEALRTQLVAALDPGSRIRAGERARLWLEAARLHLFDGRTGESLRRGAGVGGG